MQTTIRAWRRCIIGEHTMLILASVLAGLPAAVAWLTWLTLIGLTLA